MKKIIITIIGIIIMSYPFWANYVFEHRQDSLIETYEKTEVNGKNELIEEAREYNKALFESRVQLHDPFSEEAIGDDVEYKKLLNSDVGNSQGIMGYIEIPCIGVSLPIFHGTSEEVLQRGVGHLEGSSLPVGGESSHSVLTGHTGINKAKMFTDLVQMEEGDIFVVSVLGEKFAYRVDQIKVIEPSDVDHFLIKKGKDYCTLVTCTPYGVNSHRLIVRGERTEYVEEEVESVEVKTEESQWMLQYKKSLIVAIAFIIVVLFIQNLIRKRKQKK